MDVNVPNVSNLRYVRYVMDVNVRDVRYGLEGSFCKAWKCAMIE